ncbi:MAG TPA: hypothetical protein VMM57_05190 [Bacteroidota bacterium]|nr:hypothetical protein [Bacteroidota bacterium]
MGSTTLLDIIGSFFIGGILLIMGMRLNAESNENTAVYNGNYILQMNITTLISLLETDFRRIGYCRDWTKIPDPSQAVRIADTSRLRYWTDVNNAGHLDSITYYVGPPSELSSTPNPYDRYLYRQVNTNTALQMNLGVTQFNFIFKDALDDTIHFPITNPANVYYMQLTVQVQSAVPYAQEYMNDPSQYDVFWKELRLVTKNLKNR